VGPAKQRKHKERKRNERQTDGNMKNGAEDTGFYIPESPQTKPAQRPGRQGRYENVNARGEEKHRNSLAGVHAGEIR
jgi:hypothetical protein